MPYSPDALIDEIGTVFAAAIPSARILKRDFYDGHAEQALPIVNVYAYTADASVLERGQALLEVNVLTLVWDETLEGLWTLVDGVEDEFATTEPSELDTWIVSRVGPSFAAETPDARAVVAFTVTGTVLL